MKQTNQMVDKSNSNETLIFESIDDEHFYIEGKLVDLVQIYYDNQTRKASGVDIHSRTSIYFKLNSVCGLLDLGNNVDAYKDDVYKWLDKLQVPL